MMVLMPSGLLNSPSLGYGEYDQFSILDSQARNRTGICHQYINGELDLQMDNFSIRILNETYPHFMFWNAMNQTGDQYHVRMMELVEFNDTNGDGIPQLSEEAPGQSALSLASGTWTISSIVTENDTDDNIIALHFNYTLTGIIIPKFSGLQFQLNFHMFMDNTTISDGEVSVEVAGGQELKFDVILSGWPWYAEGNQLALRMDLSSNKNRHVNRWQVNNQFSLKWQIDDGNETAYYRHHAEAIRENNTAQSIVSVGEGFVENGSTTSLYLVYPYFGDDELRHDPILGLVVEPQNNGQLIPSIIDLLLHPMVLVVFTVLVLAVSVFVVRNKRS